MSRFQPDYRHIERAARNQTTDRMPIYEHSIAVSFMERILGREFHDLAQGDSRDLVEYYRTFCHFYESMGYDTVSFECCVGNIMPGNGSLGRHKPSEITSRADFDRYPWAEAPDIFFREFSRHYDAMRQAMPAGMKAVGGPGNGIFECVQEVTGFMDLCLVSHDDPELYSDLFRAVGDMMAAIWARFLPLYGDMYTVCRMGDDLGHKNNTMLSADDIRKHIIPQYRRVSDLIHAHGKPFLWHSCGNIFSVMEDAIRDAKIDAKHSNEDQIAPFVVWVDRYGDRIGNFGGIDTDHLCRKSPEIIREMVRDVVKSCYGRGGFALGSGNSIPDYVPAEGFLAMVEEARRLRGE